MENPAETPVRSQNAVTATSFATWLEIGAIVFLICRTNAFHAGTFLVLGR